MEKPRTTPLTPIFSSLAILSFKKKSGKGSDLGGLSTSMDDLNLEGENLSLSDLGGSVGSLSKLEKKDKKDVGDLDDDILSSLTTSGPKVDDKKFMEIEASVNDLKKHAESTDMNSKATKNELESMKKDLSSINDSIKSLLNVYEAVSRQYNPFVDNELPTAIKPTENEMEDGEMSIDGNLSLGTLAEPKDGTMADLSLSPIDEEGPLDRIVKPDDPDEEEDLDSLGKLDKVEISPSLLGKVEAFEPEPEPEPEEEPEAVVKPRPVVRKAADPDFDPYVLEQVHKLVEYQMGKVYRARIRGDDIDTGEIEALDRWMAEFKRLGGG